MYRIEITATAQANADAAYDWMVEHISASYAERWYQELFKQIGTLVRHPTRCPLAPESPKFADEVRELIFGKRRHKHKYRILFSVKKDLVSILYVYHSSRDEIEL